MTAEELLSEIKRLSLNERRELLEELSRDIRQALQISQPVASPVERERGLLKGHEILSDSDLRHDYTDYLETKYS